MGLFDSGSSSGDTHGSKLRPYSGENLSDSSSFSSDFGTSASSVGGDFQTQVAAEQQKLQLMNQIHHLNENCWDLCVGTPSSSLSGREENCLNNCVGRFIDTTLLITNRFSQLAQKLQR